MPNGITTPTVPGTTPQTGGLNIEGYRRRLQEAAARTREVPGAADLTGVKETAAKLSRAHGAFGELQGGLAKTAIAGFETQQKDIQKRAERAASALEMVGETTFRGVQRMENVQEVIRGNVQSASQSWDAAAEKADEYVKAARGRVGEVVSKLDSIFNDIQTTRDFSKAHAMQASVQAVTGSMKAEERNIVQNYGTDSKEYEQFRMSKQSTLATIQSNIHASYAQLEEQQKTAYLNATSEVLTKQNMYLGFQEQQHVEMLKYRDDSRNAYALKAAELDVSIEQMKMNGMENLANWIIETPTFTMDTTPLVTLVSDLAGIAATQWTAWRQMKRSTGKGGGLGSTLLTAGATALGTGFGGPIGGALAGSLTGGLTKKTQTGGGFGTTE